MIFMPVERLWKGIVIEQWTALSTEIERFTDKAWNVVCEEVDDK